MNTISYADDFNFFASGTSLRTATRALNTYLPRIYSWAQSNGLTISDSKSTATVFTPDPHEYGYHPSLRLQNEPLPLEQYPTVLGVKFDPKFTFNRHVDNICARAKRRLNILKALTTTSWGQQKETLGLLYRTVIRPLFNYACPVWFPTITATNVNKMQLIQNHACRIITGCHSMAAIDHLHNETELLPIDQHNQLLCAQYFCTSLTEDHPCRPLHHYHRPRTKKATVFTRFKPIFDQHFSDPPATDKHAKEMMKTLHTHFVAEYRASTSNRVLHQTPPTISASELTLDRRTRTILSQLRSGFSSILMNYRHRIDQSVIDRCPKCLQTPHDTVHLFNCNSNRTNLPVTALWTDPVDAAQLIP